MFLWTIYYTIWTPKITIDVHKSGTEMPVIKNGWEENKINANSIRLPKRKYAWNKDTSYYANGTHSITHNIHTCMYTL